MVAVFHHIGDEGSFTNPLSQILNYEGVLTFDGAYLSVWQNRKVLYERNPILFVQADTIGNPGVCSWEQILELGEEGFVLGWHGHTHRRLTELPDHAVIRELTPHNSDFKLYAYPHGDFDERTANLVKEMGYLRAYSTTQGNDDNYSLYREYI